MEFEKTLFRVHERLLQDPMSKRVLLTCIAFFFVVSSFCTVTFLLANHYYEAKQSCKASMQFLTDENETRSIYYVFQMEEQDLSLIVSSTRELISLNQSLKEAHNFTQLNRTIQKNCYFQSPISEFVFVLTIGYENLIINDLVASYPEQFDLYVKNNDTQEIWAWSKSTLGKYHQKPQIFQRLIVEILEIMKIMLGLFIQSAVATLYIKVTIICAPIFILIILECVVNLGNRQIQPGLFYRAFPWIGAYLQVLDINNRRPKSHLLLAFFLFLLLFYFIYLSTVFIGTFLLFFKSIPNRLDDNFFGFMAIVEFSAMLFFRTRATIYFAPKFIIIQYFIFFIYVQYSLYGFFYLALYCTMYWTIFTICCFLYLIEMPALQWNPQSPYTPCLERPRCLYLPLFHFGWVNDIPHIWTMFYPLHGRRFFNQNNLALVDRNFVLLNNIMRMEQNLEQEMIDINNPQPQHVQPPQQPPQPVGDQNQHLNQLQHEQEQQQQQQHELIQLHQDNHKAQE